MDYITGPRLVAVKQLYRNVSLVLLLVLELPMPQGFACLEQYGPTLISQHVEAVSFEILTVMMCIYDCLYDLLAALPEVVIQSENPITVKLGRKVSISCDVTSVNGGDEVEWYRLDSTPGTEI